MITAATTSNSRAIASGGGSDAGTGTASPSKGKRRKAWTANDLRTDPVASKAMLGGSTLGAQLGGAILFDVKRAGPGEFQLTGANQALGPTALEAEPKIAALLGALLSSSQTPNTKLDHIALSPTGGTHGAMHLVTYAADGYLDGWSGAQIVQQTGLMQKMGMLGGDYAYYHNTKRGAWLVLGPEATRVLMRLTSGRELNAKEARSAIATLRHELQHAVTPKTASKAAEKVRWMEESTASLLAGWEGGAKRTADALGIKVPLGDMDDMDPYVSGTRILRQLVAWSGVDVFAADGYDRAFDLLQGKAVQFVPERLASAICAAQGLPPAKAKELTSALLELNGFKLGGRKRLIALARQFGLKPDDRL